MEPPTPTQNSVKNNDIPIPSNVPAKNIEVPVTPNNPLNSSFVPEEVSGLTPLTAP